MRNKVIPANQKKAKCEPFELEMTGLRHRIAYLLHVKDSKIPFYEKLPKTNVFYTHFIESMKHTRMMQAATDKMEEDRMKFDAASEKIDIERYQSTAADSPKSRNHSRKRSLYE